MVDQRLGGQLGVGHDDLAGVVRAQRGVENLDALHEAGVRALLDVVAHLERPEQQDDDPAGEVLQRTLQCHADGHARRAEDGDEGGHLDAHDAHRREDEQHLEDDVDQGVQELLQRRIDLMAIVGPFHRPVQQVDELPAHEQHDARQNQLRHVLEHDIVQKLLRPGGEGFPSGYGCFFHISGVIISLQKSQIQLE